jgi:uncharacterized protein YndB with AHSA1/START domain
VIEVDVFEAVRKRIEVPVPPDEAFRLFTEEIGSWWPAESHSRVADDERSDGVVVERIVFEPRQGGRVFEVSSDGSEGMWATVTAYEPPHRIVLAWKPNDDERPPTEVEVRFLAAGSGTRVELEHRGWEVLGERGQATRNDYGAGWDRVLARFVAAASG